VAKYCITGHEVAFFTKEYFDSLCFVSGFDNINFVNLDVKRNFQKEEEI
jgi:hypothetical protein